MVFRWMVGILVFVALFAGCADKPEKQSLASPAATTSQPTSAPPPSSSENALSFTDALPTIPDIPGPSVFGALMVVALIAAVVLIRRRD